MTGASEIAAIVLAAGQGTRMKGTHPKVLHEIAGRPLVAWPIEAALVAGAGRVVAVVGYGRELVEAALRARFDSPRVSTAIQPEQRGTGDAVRCALPALAGFHGTVLIAYGDCPLLPADALRTLLRAKENGGPLALLTSIADDPSGYGRILRGPAGDVLGVREHRDCSDEERSIREVNPGVYAVDAGFLRASIQSLTAANSQGELYLTDLVELATREGPVTAVPWSIDDLRGINDRHELATAAATMRDRINEEHARAGVTLRDPATTWIDADVTLQADATIEPFVVLRGRCVIGKGARVDVGCVLENVLVSAGALLKPYTVATESRVGENARTGPFTHLRAESELDAESHVGNFVEVKRTRIGRGSKANHLAYLGDGQIGEGVNVGAGTIFCNYDGFQKHTTVLEDGVFIGSDSQLVAPVRVGRNAYVGTGSTITRDVPEDALAVARARQDNKEGYAPRLRARLRGAAARKP